MPQELQHQYESRIVPDLDSRVIAPMGDSQLGHKGLARTAAACGFVRVVSISMCLALQPSGSKQSECPFRRAIIAVNTSRVLTPIAPSAIAAELAVLFGKPRAWR